MRTGPPLRGIDSAVVRLGSHCMHFYFIAKYNSELLHVTRNSTIFVFAIDVFFRYRLVFIDIDFIQQIFINRLRI